MNSEKRIKMLEFAYAGAIADTVSILGKEGLLEKITEQKRKDQMAFGKQQAEKFGIEKPEEVFMRLSEIFNCAEWEIIKEDKGFVAEAKACLLCAMAKKLGEACPCYIYCLNPMEGMVKGTNPNSSYEVKETLWEGSKCRVEVR